MTDFVNLFSFARQWNIPHEAIMQLRIMYGMGITPEVTYNEGTPESIVQKRVRHEAAAKGVVLWRNNVGAYQDERGNFVRYGLANDSAAMNKRVKSSDLIGIRPITIEPHHVGLVIGQFVAREVKRANWIYTGTPEEQAQGQFHGIINTRGGDAAFTTGETILWTPR